MKLAVAALAALICRPVGCTNSKPLSTMVKRPLPGEMWRQILGKCELTEYVHFMLAFPEMQDLRLFERVEFDILEKAFQELYYMDSRTSEKFDYERYESIVAAIREFIKLTSGQPLVEGEAASGASKEICKAIFRLCEKFCVFCSCSTVAWRILFSSLIENLHGADIDTFIFQKYCDDILYAAALNGNYERLETLVDKSEWGWNDTVRLVAPAIARSGSAELFEKVLQVVSRQALMNGVFGSNVVIFNKRELFLEFVLQLKPELDGTYLNVLEDICWACCQHERHELVRVLIEHHPESLQRISLTEGLFHVIKIGNMGIFTTLLGDSASPGLWTSSLFTPQHILNYASFHARVEMFRFMLSLDRIDESVLVNVFSNAVLDGKIEVMELLLGARPDGRMWMSTFSCMNNDRIIKNLGISGRVDVLEFFLRKRDKGDLRFDGFSAGMCDNVILCSACSWGKHELVRYLLRRNEATKAFIFPDVNPAVRNNRPLLKALYCMDIVRELLDQDEHGVMIYPGVAVTDQVLLRTPDLYVSQWKFLLQTVKHDDGSIRFKFPIVDINFNNHELLNHLIKGREVGKLKFLLCRDPDSGHFLLPELQVPEGLVESLRSLKVLE